MDQEEVGQTVIAVVGEVASAISNPMDDPSMQDAYNILYGQVEDIIVNGPNAHNIALIVKAVMEAIDAVGKFAHWDGPTKSAHAKELVMYILDDLHTKGKLSNDVYSGLKTGFLVLSESMFALAIIAARGQLILQKAYKDAQASCARWKEGRAKKDAALEAHKKMLEDAANGKLKSRAAIDRARAAHRK
jgi:hypothetical protein